MNIRHNAIALLFALGAPTLLQAAFLQQLKDAQQARGIRVATPEELQFEQQTKNLANKLTNSPSMNVISADNIHQASSLLGDFYALFFNPSFIRFSTQEFMNNCFEQLKNWHDTLKKKNIIVPFAESMGNELKSLLVLALKEICLFGRYSKYKEEHLITFKLRLQYILTSIMMDQDLLQWKLELIERNEQFSPGSFYSWDIDLIKSEFKDSAALKLLFNKLSQTIDQAAEQRAAQTHAREVALEKEHIAERKRQAADLLRTAIAQTAELSQNEATRSIVYIDYIRILLDPAYLELAVSDRKIVDKMNDQFKNLHTVIGKTFMPVLPEEGFSMLKFLVARALETIHSTAIKQTGGIAFKNHVELVIKSLMTIQQSQSLVENQIKFQWIKPLYLDNDMLTADLKKKLFDLFGNNNYQRWYVGAKNYTLKTATPINTPAAQAPVIETPSSLPETSKPEHKPIVISLQPPRLTVTETSEDIIKTRPLPQPTQRPVERTTSTSTVTTQAPSTNLMNLGQNIISQSLVAPLANIQKNLAQVQPDQKFDLLKITDDSLYTAVHAAASLGRANVLELLLKNLMPNQRFEIIKMREKDGQTALHLAASAKSAPDKGFKPAVAVEELLKGLTPAQQDELIKMKDNAGETALDIARGYNKAVAGVLSRASTR